MATCPNTVVKVSAMFGIDRQWTRESVIDIVQTVISTFGIRRLVISWQGRTQYGDKRLSKCKLCYWFVRQIAMWLEFEWLIQLQRCFDRCELDCPSDPVHRADRLNMLTNTSVWWVGGDSSPCYSSQLVYILHAYYVVCCLYGNNSRSL